MISFSASARYGYGGKQFIARITGRHPKFTFAYEFIGRKGGKRNEDCSADVDSPGLYITRDIDSKGRVDDDYYVVFECDGVLHKDSCDKDDAMKIGKAMDAGRSFDSIIQVWPADPLAKLLKLHRDQMAKSANHEPDHLVTVAEGSTLIDLMGVQAGQQVMTGSMRVVRQNEIARLTPLATVYASPRWEFATPKEAAKIAAAQTIDTAMKSCLAILQSLPEKEATKVLTQLNIMVSPAKNPSGRRIKSPVESTP